MLNTTFHRDIRKKNYWDILVHDILQNKQLVFFVLLTGILCFGFTICNYSIGVDDPARRHYLYSQRYGNMIQQGRLMHVVLNTLTRTVAFIPFFTECTGMILYVLSALLFCSLIQYIVDSVFSTGNLASFACVYISSSIMAEKFIYQLDVITLMISYCLIPIAVMYAYQYVGKKDSKSGMASVVCLMVAISSYESFVFVYVCAVFAVFILEMQICSRKMSLRQLIKEGLIYAGLLCVAVICYYILVFLIQLLSGQIGVFERNGVWNQGAGLLDMLHYTTMQILRFFRESISVRYIPIVVFCLFSMVGTVLCGFFSIKKKNILILLCFAGMWISNFFIHYIHGSFLSRAAQTFCFFSGFVILILVYSSREFMMLKRFLFAAVVILVFVQAADMNRWFYNDYVRYKKEEYVIHGIANDLGEYDLSKPVVLYVGNNRTDLKVSIFSGGQSNGDSLIEWTANAFGYKMQPFVPEVFYMHGYNFIQSPTEEQYEHAANKAESMPAWPAKGSIQELDDFIIVNLKQKK